MSDILFKNDDYIFSYRVGGLLIQNGKILLQHIPGDEGYAIVGGHVAFGEVTSETLMREFKEEIHADIKIERLLLVGENFFRWDSRPCHQINLYYLVSLLDESQIPLDGTFKAFDKMGNERINLEMSWIPISKLHNMIVYPKEIKEHIFNLPDEIVYFVHKE